MSKPKAHLILILFDILAISVFWIGHNEISQVFGGIAHSAESVEFNNRDDATCGQLDAGKQEKYYKRIVPATGSGHSYYKQWTTRQT